MKPTDRSSPTEDLMTQRCTILTGIGVWTLLFAAPAVSRANAVVFSNFGAGFSYDTGDANFIGNAFDGSGSNYAQGATFTPTATSIFGSLDIALSCFFVCPNNFTVSLASNVSDSPA